MGLIHGADSTGKAMPLLVDASGRPLVLSHGWVGGAWQKNPLLLGYSGIVKCVWDNLTLAAGDNTIDGPIVPAGEIWVITAVIAQYVGAVATELIMRVNSSGSGIAVLDVAPPTTLINYNNTGTWILAPGDFLQGFVRAAALNDDFRGRGLGYRVDIDQ